MIPDDVSIYPVLAELVACLCAELGEEAPCFCGLIVGQQEIPVEYDGCESCAAGYVRLDNVYPARDFPNQDQDARCYTSMAFAVTVGVARCAPMGDGEYPPTAEEWAEFARVTMADMAMIRRAISCCLRDDKFEDIEYVMGTYTPIPNMGGVGGGEWSLTIRERI